MNVIVRGGRLGAVEALAIAIGVPGNAGRSEEKASALEVMWV